jgi:hypothetical protein
MNPNPRISNSLNGVIRTLENTGSIDPQEAKSLFRAFTSSFKEPWTRREAWEGLVSRFGLQEVREDRFVFYIPTGRNI